MERLICPLLRRVVRPWNLSFFYTLWLAHQLHRCVLPQKDIPNSISQHKKKIPAVIPFADKPFGGIKKSESGWSSAWLEKVQHGWAWMAFASGRAVAWCCGFWMLKSPREEAFYGCSGKQIEVSCCCFILSKGEMEKQAQNSHIKLSSF